MAFKLNWKSLKLFYAVGASILLTIAWFITAFWISLSPQFATYKDGIVAIASLYLVAHAAADVGSQWANRNKSTEVDVKVNEQVKRPPQIPQDDIEPK